MTEEQLTGGNIAPVFRVGDTVRRQTRPWSEAVHALLLHLEKVGYEASPRFLGIDEKGREILTFIEGDVPSYERDVPEFVWTEENIKEVARLMRNFHDAVRSFEPPENARWRFPKPSLPGFIVCHNDIAPYNTVYGNEKPEAFIDWDFAGPETPEYDVVYALWRFVPTCADERAVELAVPDPARRLERIPLFLDAYGDLDKSGIVDTIIRRQMDSIEGIRALASQGNPASLRFVANGIDMKMIGDMEFVREKRAEIESMI
ncbi:MAG: phosphotransferase [Actinobacteria bacterium]|nr:phosphotransferase [Actinomycetota bacterium]